MISCPDDKTLKLFIVGNLAPQRIDEIEKHLETCPNCSQRLAKLEVGSGIPLFQGIKAAQLSGSGSMADDHSIDGVIPQTIGHYKVCDLLGAGGMGTVYLAENPHLDRQVAIKVVKASRRIHQASVDRFVREMKAAGKLQHPNIVQSHDGGVIGNTVDGQPFLVMEFLEGSDLSEYVKDHGPFSVEKACDIIRQVASGLDYAHRLGFVHRDIKPSNLWITPEGTVKILDFGLVNILETETLEAQTTTPLHETALGSILGSPDYISPEQIVDSKKADNRSDIYSLGCTFFFLLTGRPPFDKSTHPNLDAKLQAHAKQDLPPLRPFRNDVPIAVEAVLRRMTAKRPEDRYQNAEAVLKAIANLKPTRTKWIVGVLASIMLVLVGVYLFLPKPPNSVPLVKPSVEPTIPDVAIEEPSIVEEKPMEPPPEPIPSIAQDTAATETKDNNPNKQISLNATESPTDKQEVPGVWRLKRSLYPKVVKNTGGLESAFFARTGNAVIGTQDIGIIQLWDTNGNKSDFFETAGFITSIALSPDGRWLAFSATTKDDPLLRGTAPEEPRMLPVSPYHVELFDFTTGRKHESIIPLTADIGPITSLSFSSDSKLLFLGGTCGEILPVDNTDRKSGTDRHIVFARDLGGRILTSAFSDDGSRIYFGDEKRQVHCYSTVKRYPPPGWNTPIARPIELAGNITCIKPSPSDPTSVMALTGNNYIDRVSVKSKASRLEISLKMESSRWEHPKDYAKIDCMAISPDEKHAILGGSRVLDIWDMEKDVIESSHWHWNLAERVISVDYNKDGTLFLARFRDKKIITYFEYQTWRVILHSNKEIEKFDHSKPNRVMPRGGSPGLPNATRR